MSEWFETRIGEQVLLQRGFDITKAQQRAGSIPVVSSGGISSFHDTPATSGPGVVLGRKGTLGTVFYIPGDYWPHDTTLWVKEFRGNHPRFVYYFFKSIAEDLLLMDVGTSNPALNRNHIHPITTLWPTRSLQERIAELLGVLDDKIVLNCRTNRTLAATAAALFQQWCDENGASMTDVLAEDLIERGVLLINDGYRAKNSEMASSGLPFARAGNLHSHFDFAGADLLGETGVRAAREKVSQPFDCVFTSKGTVGRIAQVLPSTPHFVYSPQLCFWRTLRPAELNPFVLFQWMNSEEFREQVNAVKGQTDMADYVSLRDQRRMQVTLPFSVDQQSIGARLEALAQLQNSNNAESAKLSKVRDELLPQLISGAIRLRGVERLVEANV